MKRPCIYILFRIFLIILANRSFGQEQLIEKEDKNDSLLLVHFENIIQKYKPNELELFRSKIKNIDLEEGTIKYLEALSVKKLYQPDSVVVLPLLMVHSTQKLFRDSVLNLKLNTFDTLYTFLSDEFSGYLFKKKKYYEATVYLVQCLLPYKKMYGEKSKHFIKSLIKMGDYGLSMTERLNSFNDYMVFPKILLEEYHQNTQFYIDMYAYITKIYFQKHIYSSMEDSGSKTLIAISNNKSLQTDKNVDLISKIAYYFYSFESAFDTGEQYLTFCWQFRAENIDSINTQRELSKIDFDEAYIQIYRNKQNKVFPKNDPTLYLVKSLRRRKKIPQSIATRTAILLGQYYLRLNEFGKLEKIIKSLSNLKTTNEQIVFEKNELIVDYHIKTKNYKEALKTTNDYLLECNIGNISRKRIFNKKKIFLLTQLNQLKEAEELIGDEVYLNTYLVMNEDQIMNEGNMEIFRNSNFQDFSFFQEALSRINYRAIQEKYDLGLNNIDDFLFYLINELKGTILNKHIDFKKVVDSKPIIPFDIENELNQYLALKKNINNTDINLIDSLMTELFYTELRLKRLLNPIIHVNQTSVDKDSLVKYIDEETIVLNIAKYDGGFYNLEDTTFSSQIKYVVYGLRKKGSNGIVISHIIEGIDLKEYPLSYFWQKLPYYFFKKGVKKIIICSDGELLKYNWNLISEPDGKLLIDEYDMRFITSMKDLININLNIDYQNTALLIGNPSFNLKEQRKGVLSKKNDTPFMDVPIYSSETFTRGGIKSLPYTQKEVEGINKILFNKGFKTNMATGIDAIEEAVKSAKSPRILHIATHGFFEPDINLSDTTQKDFLGIKKNFLKNNPLLRSGLLFAGVEDYLKTKKLNPNYENGILTAYEVLNMNLENTELVVLSACDTGLGEVKNGEGVYGLQRAFKIAGAKSILMSLSKVPDEATQVLMTEFYKNWLEKGMEKHKALKEAQLTMKANPKYTDPVNWGAFVLIE